MKQKYGRLKPFTFKYSQITLFSSHDNIFSIDVDTSE